MLCVLGMFTQLPPTLWNGRSSKLYQNNPQVNSQRAAVRVTTRMYRRRFRLSPTHLGYRQRRRAVSRRPFKNGSITVLESVRQLGTSHGLTATQTVLNGFQTPIGHAKQRARFRQRVKICAHRTYNPAVCRHGLHELIRDDATKIVRSNVDVLAEQLRQTRDRSNVGEVTRTDVAQAGSPACRRTRHDAFRTIQLRDIPLILSANHRGRGGQTRAGGTRRQAFARSLAPAVAGRASRILPSRLRSTTSTPHCCK